jgi:DNA primase
MANYDMEKLFEDYGIDFSVEGKNTSPDFLQTQCIFCDDSTNHLGVHRLGTHTSCWKCGRHTTKDFVKKVCKTDYPLTILKNYRVFEEQIKKEEIERPTIIEVPGTKKYLKIHRKYLRDRNFDIDYLTDKYDLRFTDHLGSYIFRIIFPIYFNGKIISFQGRDITGKQELRYKACPKKNEIIYHKDILYNIDNCKDDKIIVVEGIFDCIRLGDNCACTFGTGFTENQVKMLKKYKKVYILYDNEETAYKKGLDLGLRLSAFNVKCETIKINVDDPAEMTEEEVKKLKKELGVD